MRRRLSAALVGTLLAACGGQSPSPSADDTPPAATHATRSSASSQPSPTSPEQQPSAAASTSSPAAEPSGPGWQGRVVAEAVRLRVAPGLGAPGVAVPAADAPPYPVFVGTATRNQEVYVLDGPVEADGIGWYLVAPTDGDHFIAPQFAGWMAGGDEADTWLVEEALACPDGAIELADITYAAASWAVRLGCFGSRQLTLLGWFPAVPDEMSSHDCQTALRFLLCGAEGIRPIEMDFFDPRNVDRVDFALDPEAGLTMPRGDQWIELTGAFDHPSAGDCAMEVDTSIPEAYDLNVLSCRLRFVATRIEALGR